MPRYHALLILTLVGFTGCAGDTKKTETTTGVTPTSGQAWVVESNPATNELLLQIGDARKAAYWTSDTIFFRGDKALANYAVPKGALIEYRGVVNRNEIWLRGVKIIRE